VIRQRMKRIDKAIIKHIAVKEHKCTKLWLPIHQFVADQGEKLIELVIIVIRSTGQPFVFILL
jgi:hypothetical protein